MLRSSAWMQEIGSTFTSKIMRIHDQPLDAEFVRFMPTNYKGKHRNCTWITREIHPKRADEIELWVI